jgi:hypothetical protein
MDNIITFSKLKNRDNPDGPTTWGLRASKSSPDEQPPAEGSTVIVTKKGGETQEVTMGRVIAQGDDYWLADIAGRDQSSPDRYRTGENERKIHALIDEVRELRRIVDKLASSQVDEDIERAAIQGEQEEVDPWA